MRIHGADGGREREGERKTKKRREGEHSGSFNEFRAGREKGEKRM